MPEQISYQIKKELQESNYGWTTKQVEKELIIKKSGIKYHYTHIYPVYFENGALSRKYQEKYMLILHPSRKRRLSKKGRPDICG
jgi:putative transposase